MESLYLAYNDECDSARVNHIRKQLLGTKRFLAEGYMPFTTWSKTKLGCSTDEIKRNIKEGLERSAATLVLVGPDAATNPWIRYAIELSYTMKKPLIALYINELPDERGVSADADLNPLERFAVMERGKKVYLSDRYATHTWSDVDDGMFDRWLDEAKNGHQQPRFRMPDRTFANMAAEMASTGSHSITNHDFDITNA